MSTLMETARAEATQEVCSTILKAADKAMLRHGDDEHRYATAIIAAGFAMAINAMGENIDSRIPKIIRNMLNDVS